MVPPEILNNYAVMLMEVGKQEEAKTVLLEALKNCEGLRGENEDLRLRALTITTRFNLGCCLQNQNNIGEASEIFKAITREEPSYQDAHIRLAYLAKKRGDFIRAIQHVDCAMANALQKPPHSKPVNLHCIRGRFLVEMGRQEDGKKEFQQAMVLS